ncbi:uncharacterized protein H6S33_008523 [Morchella sextelata]|uniref:uncharacterized protein n=1 Tax=Morchella sextelata TaxID=1174677 RepID=UPI001D053B54|nr:uncharacterized protein H6S33_008523 [Morchella sextelata]KAH0602873.1 hypothetical protein H6S33_008523 [Morchella sextelata]
MFKTLKNRLPRSLSRKAATAPPEAQNSGPVTTAAVVEKTPAPYLPAPRRKTSTLFELEALLSSIIDSHHHCGQDARAVVERGEKAREGSGGGGGVLPSYEELYKELEREKDDAEPQVSEISGFMTVQSVPHLPSSQQQQQPAPPILRRKPKGLVGHKRSTREKALEALMRLLDQCEDDEEEEEERVKRARKFPSVENMGAVRRRALEGLRRRGWDVTVISSSGSRRRDGGQGVLHAVS